MCSVFFCYYKNSACPYSLSHLLLQNNYLIKVLGLSATFNATGGVNIPKGMKSSDPLLADLCKKLRTAQNSYSSKYQHVLSKILKDDKYKKDIVYDSLDQCPLNPLAVWHEYTCELDGLSVLLEINCTRVYAFELVMGRYNRYGARVCVHVYIYICVCVCLLWSNVRSL